MAATTVLQDLVEDDSLAGSLSGASVGVSLPASGNAGRLFLAIIHEREPIDQGEPITLGGESMTLVASVENSFEDTLNSYIYKVQSDTLSGNVNLEYTTSTSSTQRLIGIYYIDDLQSTTEHDTLEAENFLDDFVIGNLNVPSEGTVVGSSLILGSSTDTASWTGLTKDNDHGLSDVDDNSASYAHEDGLTSETSRVIEASWSTTYDGLNLVAVSFQGASASTEYSEAVDAQVDFTESIDFAFSTEYSEAVDSQVDLSPTVGVAFEFAFGATGQIDLSGNVASSFEFTLDASSQVDLTEEIVFEFNKVLLSENISAQVDFSADISKSIEIVTSVASQVDFSPQARLLINLGLDVSATIDFTESIELSGAAFLFDIEAQVDFTPSVSPAFTKALGVSSEIEFSPSVLVELDFWNRELGISDTWTEESPESASWSEENSVSESWTEESGVSDSWSEESPLSKSWTEETPL